ncbi:MAG TPA: MCE family protein, partial [Epsilonproteobacteria bacterium]|nr:MCE family protein [Campylobacterota bacterium]
MNNRTNYTMVGVFVIVTIVLLTASIYWLMKPTDERKMNEYIVYFTESVSGLNIDSPVKYRGIPVGKVKSMEINPNNSEEIMIRISIRDKTPIKIDTVATLMSQGITGLNFIDLSKGSKEAQALLCSEENPIPVIPSAPSFFARFDDSIGTVSTQVSKTL